MAITYADEFMRYNKISKGTSYAYKKVASSCIDIKYNTLYGRWKRNRREKRCMNEGILNASMTEEKEIIRLRRELRDTKYALEVSEGAGSILGK